MLEHQKTKNKFAFFCHTLKTLNKKKLKLELKKPLKLFNQNQVIKNKCCFVCLPYKNTKFKLANLKDFFKSYYLQNSIYS